MPATIAALMPDPDDRRPLRAGEELVTPALAAEWLKHMGPQRPLALSRVEEYMRAMQRGAWQRNGEAIIFDTAGRLIDGQHRLHAIARAGCSLPMLVVGGVAPDAILTIDCGGKRTSAQRFAMVGEPNAVVLASVARLMYLCDRGALGGDIVVVSHQEIMETVNRHPLIRTAAAGVNGGKGCGKVGNSAALGFIYLVGLETDPVRADGFLAVLKTGVVSDPYNGAHALRERLLTNRAAKARLRPIEILAITIKAWNAFRVDRPVKTLRWRNQGPNPEPFPTIDGYPPRARITR